MFTKEAILRTLNNPVIEYSILQKSNSSEEPDEDKRKSQLASLLDRLFNGGITVDKVEPLRLSVRTVEGDTKIVYANSRFVEE